MCTAEFRHQMGPDGHVLTFPINSGKVLNLVAFRTDPNDWSDFNKLTKPATRESVLRDFEGWGPNVTELLKLTRPDLDCVRYTLHVRD